MNALHFKVVPKLLENLKVSFTSQCAQYMYTCRYHNEVKFLSLFKSGSGNSLLQELHSFFSTHDIPLKFLFMLCLNFLHLLNSRFLGGFEIQTSKQMSFKPIFLS